jgi:sarcosine oxidase subunit beta
MSDVHDAIVIGAGIVGSCITLELARQGRKVVCLDSNAAAGLGSTSVSCAIVRTHYSTLQGTAMAFEGYHYWRRWPDYLAIDDERGFARFLEVGCLVIKDGSDSLLPTLCDNLDALGIHWETWSAPELKERLPTFDIRQFGPAKRPADPDFGTVTGPSIEGAIFMPQAGYVTDPQLATLNAALAAQAAGAEFRFNASVTGIRRDAGRVAGVTLADGSSIHAPVVVNVAGPHSSQINALAGVLDDMTIATKPMRQEVAHVPSPADLDFERDGCVVSDADVGCYYRPEVGNNVLIGSQEPDCDDLQWVEADDYDTQLTEQWTAQVMRVAQRIPALPVTAPLRGIVGLYDVSDDWIPIYDKSNLPGFYMAVGTSGNQFKNAPVAGHIMAELITACEGGRDHDIESLKVRYRHIAIDCDVGFFSRRREINRDSSFSVLG